MVCKTAPWKYTKQSDEELNTLLNDIILVSPRYFFNVPCRTNIAIL